ncbi:MAG: hypothetical protein QRY72_03485 [Candidatus Rhabdochlamydia sp.]
MDVITPWLQSCLSFAKGALGKLSFLHTYPFRLQLALFCSVSLMLFSAAAIWILSLSNTVSHAFQELEYLTGELHHIRTHHLTPAQNTPTFSSFLSSLQTNSQEIPFLEKEKNRLSLLIQQFPQNTFLKSQLASLKAIAYPLSFEVILPSSSPRPIYKLSHPLLMDEENLILVFHLLERGQTPYDKPSFPLIWNKFELIKQPINGGNQVYRIDMELLEP